MVTLLALGCSEEGGGTSGHENSNDDSASPTEESPGADSGASSGADSETDGGTGGGTGRSTDPGTGSGSTEPGTDPPPTPDTCASAEDTIDWNIESLEQLREAVKLSDQDIVMKPGDYSITELPDDETYFLVTGDDNTIDLTCVHLDIPVELGAKVAHFRIEGTGNTLIGGTIENTYRSGVTEITDYVSYNRDRQNLAKGGRPHLVIAGDNTTILGTTMIVRGSFPFGYGSFFGIGRNSTYGAEKRGGIQVVSSNTVIDGIKLYMEAFGHAIYIQSEDGEFSDNTKIRNSLIQGIIRPTNDILAETEGLAYDADFKDSDGDDIPTDATETLSEDGIRTYPNVGSVFVDNCTVIGMRGGIRPYMATESTVTNSTALDNRLNNFQMSDGGKVSSSTANFAYGPAIWFWQFRHNQEFDITLLPSPHAIGPHNIADIDSTRNTVVFRRSPGPEDTDETRVIAVNNNNNNITNYTEYTIVLASGTNGNTITSAGDVIDNGSNAVTRIDLEL